MSAISMKRSTEWFGGDSCAGAAGTLWRHQNPPVRFWIISMMLVLIGLSSLKLR
jgi:UDP-N-acetylmuramyl pentapeptide phosphotransferase/UDP-N-acetylglucosamine-1-phosphate transferase